MSLFKVLKNFDLYEVLFWDSESITTMIYIFAWTYFSMPNDAAYCNPLLPVPLEWFVSNAGKVYRTDIECQNLYNSILYKLP